ncbi:MAG: NAD(P)-dependent oxidoreductase [Alphaproteobacteria bacterium]|jgi:phosphoglycerate dehydrogenase-like enzyme|nr:NAD(P)-dependent oxidoreductase [Alphaproteobacteria bacterium]
MTVNIAMHQAAYERVREQLQALDLPVRPLLIDDQGRYTSEGREISLADNPPEAFWLTLDVAYADLFEDCLETILTQPTVKWLQTFNAGLDHPRYRDFVGKDIRIANSSAQAVAIAEYTFAHVLGHYQPLAERKAAQVAKEWRRTPFPEIWRSTWLLVGLGHIGKAIARRARAFEVRVLAVRSQAAPSELADETGTLADLPRFLPQADVVVLACPLNDQTRGLADAAFFSHVKAGSIFVNVARGGIVDDAALIAALDRGAIETAILDVFEPEPLPTSDPYWSHASVQLTAHTSFAGTGVLTRGDELFLGNLPRYLAGEPLVNEVDLAAVLGA